MICCSSLCLANQSINQSVTPVTMAAKALHSLNNTFQRALLCCIRMCLHLFFWECSPLLIFSERGNSECVCVSFREKACTYVVCVFFILSGAAGKTCSDTPLYTGSQTETDKHLRPRLHSVNSCTLGRSNRLKPHGCGPDAKKVQIHPSL